MGTQKIWRIGIVSCKSWPKRLNFSSKRPSGLGLDGKGFAVIRTGKPRIIDNEPYINREDGSLVWFNRINEHLGGLLAIVRIVDGDSMQGVIARVSEIVASIIAGTNHYRWLRRKQPTILSVPGWTDKG